MAHNEITIEAPAETVYGFLADPETYPRWLVGAKAIRSTDAAFPRPGARFRHRVGVGPLEVRDETISLEAKPGERLVLRAKARPVGEALVSFELHGRGEATRVVMDEHVVEPAIMRLLSPVVDCLTRARNGASLAQLKDLIEGD